MAKKLIKDVAGSRLEVIEIYKQSYDAQREAHGLEKKYANEVQKAAEMQTKALEKQNEVVEESKSRFEQWLRKVRNR